MASSKARAHLSGGLVGLKFPRTCTKIRRQHHLAQERRHVSEVEDAVNQALGKLGNRSDMAELPADDAVAVAQRAMGNFVVGDPRAWWLSLKLPARQVEVPPSGFDYLRGAWPIGHSRAYFIPEDETGKYRVFDATPDGVVRLLQDCPFFEFYVVAKDFSWLLAESDHNVLWVCQT